MSCCCWSTINGTRKRCQGGTCHNLNHCFNGLRWLAEAGLNDKLSLPHTILACASINGMASLAAKTVADTCAVSAVAGKKCNCPKSSGNNNCVSPCHLKW